MASVATDPDVEIALVERVRRGDEQAFEQVVRAHADAVWRLARTYLHDHLDAEESVQDTFLKAYRGIGGFRGESGLRTWLLAICHRTCIDRLRRSSTPEVPLEAAGELAVFDENDLRLSLEAALPHLPDDERMAFALIDVLGYSGQEAATIVGVPASTMRSRVARARAHLLEVLGPGGNTSTAGPRR